MTPHTQKALIWAKNWHFLAIFGQKNIFFWVMAALKRVLNDFRGMPHISL